MACACIRGTYDFDLDQTHCEDIVYIDRSIFQEGAEFSEPEYDLTIINPDGEETNHHVVASTPLHLSFPCAPGVYTFRVISCKDKFTKKTAILCSLWCGYLRAVNKLGSLDVEIIQSIRARLEYIPTIANTDTVTATRLTKTVIRDLRRINCECSCD